MNPNCNAYHNARLKPEEAIGIPLSEMDQSVIEDVIWIVYGISKLI